MIVVLLVLSIVMLVVDLNEFGGQHAKMLFSAFAPKNWKTTFHVADAAVLIFWVVCLISTLQSEYLDVYKRQVYAATKSLWECLF